VREKLQAEINKINRDGSGVNKALPVGVGQDIVAAKTLIGLIDSIPQSGGIPGTGATGLIPNYFLSPEGQDARFTINNIKAEIAKLRGGTSFTPNEQKLLESYIPSQTDTDYTIQGKLRNLRNFLENKAANLESTFGASSGQQTGQIDQSTIDAWRASGFSDEDIQLFMQEQQGFNAGSSNTQTKSSWVGSVGNGKLTQDFNTPVSYIKGRSTHGGLDIDGKIGDPVPSPVSGKVISAGSETGWGNTVVIEDAQGNRWRIAHMNNLNVRPGMQVTNGMLLGALGNTGYVLKSEGGDGSHVHMEIKDRNGKLINPHSLIG
jgi:murein DD-endopeptidase MepM/ murein hydrolase activator NlpD